MDKYEKQMKDDGYMRLQKHHLGQLISQGFCYVEIAPGVIRRITTDDLSFNAEEIHAFEQKCKDEGKWNHEKNCPDLDKIL